MAARLSEVLLRANLITRDQLEQAMAQHKLEGGRLGTILTKLGFMKEEDVTRCLAEHYGIPYIDLDAQAIGNVLRDMRNAERTAVTHFILDDFG